MRLQQHFTLMDPGTGLNRGLAAQLESIGASHAAGLCDDPHAAAQTLFHFFHPSGPAATVCAVLFHGTGNDALFCWEDLILELLKSGRAVVSFDLPGHGQNSSTELSAASFAECGRFLPQLLPALCPTCEVAEAIGYSLGALAALQLVTADSLRWQRLIMLALPERVKLGPRFIVMELLTILRKSYWRQLLRYGWDASIPAFGWIRRRRFPIRLAPAIRMSYPRFVDALFQSADPTVAIQGLSIPVLLLYGSQDYLASAAFGQGLSQHCQLVQGANHFLLPLMSASRALIMKSLLTSPQHPSAN